MSLNYFLGDSPVDGLYSENLWIRLHSSGDFSTVNAAEIRGCVKMNECDSDKMGDRFLCIVQT